MTQVQLKLEDAATQMKLAIAHSADERIFRSCINSYISLARSVTFVMEAESSEPLLKAWYKAQTKEIGSAPLLRFFNSQRVHSIHKGVVSPRSASYPIAEVSFRQEISSDGKTRVAGEIAILAPSAPASAQDVVTTVPSGAVSVWTFDGVEKFLPGDSGNVFRLCEQYFLILKWLVQEWLRERQRLGLSAS